MASWLQTILQTLQQYKSWTEVPLDDRNLEYLTEQNKLEEAK